ncbi:MAG: hypothetical protein MH321_01845 [Leptospiraceae bacterium]|nr:hypothetical protein [Leptospiraceae bacterium]
MKKIQLFILILCFSAIQPMFAKCMYGSDWTKSGKKIVVCINGDSYPDRNKGKEICEKVKGSSCSSPSTFSSSCANNECYDASGKNHNSLSGF